MEQHRSSDPKMESDAMSVGPGRKPLSTSGSKPTPTAMQSFVAKIGKLSGATFREREGGDASPTRSIASVYL